MEKILAYAPNKRAALRAPRKMRPSYRVASDTAQLKHELKTFKPKFVLADVAMPDSGRKELVRLVGDRAAVVVVDASEADQVKHVVRLLNGEKKIRPASLIFGDRDRDRGRRGRPLLNVEEEVRPASLLSVETLHDPKTGRLNAAQIARWLGISLTQFSRFLGRSVQTVHKTPASAALQGVLGVYGQVAVSLLSLFGTRERSRIWLNAPNPELDGATPMSLFSKRKAYVVAQLLEDALLGHPG
jgi:hypothetical protein